MTGSTGPVERAYAAWNRFWFRPAHTHTLALVRVFFGIALLMRWTNVHGLHRLDRLDPSLPRYEYDEQEMYGAFSMPWPGFEWIPSPTLWWYHRIDEAMLALLVLFTLGLFTRVVGLVLAAISVYVFLASQMNYYHHVWCYTLVLTILAFSRCGAHYSLDAYLRAPRPAPALAPILPLRLLQVMVSLLYFFTFISKCNEGWFSGRIMYLFHESESIGGLFHGAALSAFGYQGLSTFTVLAEGFLAFGLWVPRLRAPAIAVGVMLHLGIDALMPVRSFSYQMLALYPAFLLPEAGRTVVLMGGRLRSAYRLRAVVNLFDWLRRLSWLDVGREDVRERLPEDVRRLAERSASVVTPEGRVLVGSEAWRFVLLRLPLTFLPSLLLWLPGISHLARALQRALDSRASRARPFPAERPENEPVWQRSLERLRTRAESVEEVTR